MAAQLLIDLGASLQQFPDFGFVGFHVARVTPVSGAANGTGRALFWYVGTRRLGSLIVVTNRGPLRVELLAC
jgi:hypothetical protein